MDEIKDIKAFIKSLENEIKTTTDDAYKFEQLARLKEVAQKYEGEDKVIPSSEIVERLKLGDTEPKYLTGWTGVDAILDGFRQKQLVVISAPTKSGKTSWCIDLTTKWKAYNPLWLPFEEGAEELLQKFIDRNEEPPHFVTPQRMNGNRMVWLEKKIIESIAKYDSKIVFIDHLHFIVDMGGEANMSLKIGETMRALKQLAKKWDIVIFIIAHLKKTQMDEPPTLEDLRDSSFIAQEADTVIMLWREMKKENKEIVITDNVILSVQANRRKGKTGNVRMIFNNGHFNEYEWKSYADQAEAAFDKAF